MNPQIMNWKSHVSGALVGFFDLAVAGLVVTGCKAFRKPAESGEDRLWFSWPSEKRVERDGSEKYRDVVTTAEPVMRHLQALVRPQLKALIEEPHHSDTFYDGSPRGGWRPTHKPGTTKDYQLEFPVASGSSEQDGDIPF